MGLHEGSDRPSAVSPFLRGQDRGPAQLSSSGKPIQVAPFSGEAAGWLRWPLVTSVSLSIPIPSPGDSADVRVVFWMEGKSGMLGENPDPAPFAV